MLKMYRAIKKLKTINNVVNWKRASGQQGRVGRKETYQSVEAVWQLSRRETFPTPTVSATESRNNVFYLST